MLQFRTQGYNGTSVKYSPFFDNKLAVSTSANYGLIGNGRLYILSIQPDGQITADVTFDTQDGLFDVSWSEIHENHVVTANGDGSLKLFDATVGQFPVMQWKEHTREVFSVDWNLVEKTTFLSSSWDGFVKVWNPQRKQSLISLNTNKPGFKSNCAYQATFSPHNKDMLTTVSANGYVQVYDLRLGNPKVSDFLAHAGFEILTCDWNKYRPTVIATGSVDKTAKVWDLRMLDSSMISSPTASPLPLNQFLGHEFAVKKVVWSPHDGSELISCSYDMTARVWNDYTYGDAKFSRFKKNQSRVFNRHREFVVGADYSLWGEPGWCATVGWDEMVYIFDSKRL